MEAVPDPVQPVRHDDARMRRRWLVFFIALFPLTATWSLVNPMFASPDEPTHILRAQSIAAGDFTNPFTSDGLPVDSMDCFSFQPEVTAACQDLTWGLDGTQRVGSTDGYPPLFHSLAAVPAVFVSGLGGAYLMRLWVAVVAVALIAWAAALATRPGLGPWPVTGVALGVTPMAIFSVATVNPSGLAVASATLFVVGALSLSDSRWRGRDVAVATLVGGCGLALSRRDGVVWLVVLTIVLAPMWISRVGQLWRRRTKQTVAWSVAVVVVAVAVTGIWGRPTLGRFWTNFTNGDGTSWWEAARYIRGYLSQVVGVLGWLDSPIPEEAFLVVLVVVGFIVVLGLVSDNRRRALGTALGLTAFLLAPIVFGLIRFPYLQGRYLLPIWIATTVIAGAAAGQGDTGVGFDRRASRVVLVVWAGIHLIAGIQNLRRYAVGRSGSWNFVSGADWHPPTMSNLVAVLLYVLTTLIAVGGFWFVLRSEVRSDSDFLGQPPTHATEDRPPDHQARR